MPDREKFKFILQIKIPGIIGLIAEETGLDLETAARLFYSSEIYRLLEDEETKLWGESNHYLAHQFMKEYQGGKESGD